MLLSVSGTPLSLAARLELQPRCCYNDREVSLVRFLWWKITGSLSATPLSLWMRVYIGSEASMCGSLKKHEAAKQQKRQFGAAGTWSAVQLNTLFSATVCLTDWSNIRLSFTLVFCLHKLFTFLHQWAYFSIELFFGTQGTWCLIEYSFLSLNSFFLL